MKRITIIRIALFVGTAISLYFVPWPIIGAWIRPLPDTVQGQLDEAVAHGFDGMIAYVDQAGKAPEYYAAGWHDRANKIPARPNAYFKIASISKLYDAVAIAKLVHAGKLSLDGTLADYFPELVGRIDYADQITLRMMVQHRSGIPNITDTPNFWVYPPASREESLERVLDLPASFEPGTDYQYSNTNYVLIDMLIEKVVPGTKFNYFQDVILNPRGLTHTFGSMDQVDLDDMMSGYYVGVQEDLKASDYGTKLTSMVATAEDVGIFLRALNDGSVFKEGEQEIYSSIYAYEHTGLMPGYESIARYHPDMDAVVILFANTTHFEGYNWSIFELTYSRILKILRNSQTE
ncbi:serine hydrolase domain-containing protein [Marinoscillum sp.]|uniref:serine hydrolase domain-containing protein n=1 Tax=Marinoscillum sp. TaxID=2024838 RepID=UPI003BA87D94